MCNLASFVLTRTAEFWCETNSHEDIIEIHGLHADGARGPNIVRVEIHPSATPLDLSTWTYHVDQDLMPEWYDAVDCERRARAALARAWPAMHGWRCRVACYAPNLTAEQRYELARAAPFYWRGQVACYAPNLTADQRYGLARESTTYCRGEVACYAPGLTADQRYGLASSSTLAWRGLVARDAPDLTADQRIALALASTHEWRCKVARDAPGLTTEQRVALAAD